MAPTTEKIVNGKPILNKIVIEEGIKDRQDYLMNSDEYILIRINKTFYDLMEALERADRKGYLPDAMREEWEKLEYFPVTVEKHV